MAKTPKLMRHLFIPPVYPACLRLPLETLVVSQVKRAQVVSGQSAHDVSGLELL